MKKFEIRRDMNLHKASRAARRRQRKGNRTEARRELSALSGKLSDETEYQVREQLRMKTQQVAATKEQECRRASRRNLVPQYAYIGDSDEDESDDFVDDDYYAPYFDNSDEDEVDVSFEEPGYFEEAETAFDKHDRFPVINKELPVDKNDRGCLVLMDFLSWLDRQVGLPYIEVCEMANAIAGKDWWLVRKQLRLHCTTSGHEFRRFVIDEEGMLRRRSAKPKSSWAITSIDEVEAWLCNRHVVARGSHLYWCIRQDKRADIECEFTRDIHGNHPIVLCRHVGGGFRQDKELSDKEMTFFASLEPNVQAEILSRFKSAKELAA